MVSGMRKNWCLIAVLCIGLFLIGCEADKGGDVSGEITGENTEANDAEDSGTQSGEEGSLAEDMNEVEAGEEVLTYISSITKKGVASSRYSNGGAANLLKLEATGASWYYNWGVTPPLVETELDYVPMIWGVGNVNTTELSKVQEGYDEGRFTNLLTFNEPDMGGEAGGCNMMVEQALEAWPKLEEIGIRLSSPAVAADYNWLREFMDGCKEKGYRVDFIAVHCYQDVTDKNSVGNLKNLLVDLYDQYSLPIWLTEFGCIDISAWSGGVNPDYTIENAAAYLEECTGMLEGLGFVERYSFFLDNYGGGANPVEGRYSRLYDDNDEMNLVGETYLAVQSEVALAITNQTLEAGRTGESYYAQLEVTGGTAPYTFSATGLPTGVTLDEENGVLEGTYEKGGARLVIIVTDAKGQFTRKIYDVKDRRDE